METVEAQTKRVKVGDRVRITAPFVNPDKRIMGTISELSESVVVLSRKDSLIYISESLIQNIEVSTGEKRVIGEGLLIGAIAGSILVGAVSAITNNKCSETTSECIFGESNGEAFVSGGKIGLIAGTAIGALTGFFVKIDEWERAPVRLGVGVTPASKDIDQWAVEPGISFRIPINK